MKELARAFRLLAFAFGVLLAAQVPARAACVATGNGLATVDCINALIATLQGGTPVSIGPTTVVITWTEVTVPAASSSILLASNSARKFVRLCNTGVNFARVGYAQTPTASLGDPFLPSANASQRGDCVTFENSVMITGVVNAYAQLGTTFAVGEGQ